MLKLNQIDSKYIAWFINHFQMDKERELGADYIEPGLVSRGYYIQLNRSLISLIGGAILFLFKLHSVNSEDMMYRNRSCTMS